MPAAAAAVKKTKKLFLLFFSCRKMIQPGKRYNVRYFVQVQTAGRKNVEIKIVQNVDITTFPNLT
jgi:hypothetical protein